MTSLLPSIGDVIAALVLFGTGWFIGHVYRQQRDDERAMWDDLARHDRKIKETV